MNKATAHSDEEKNIIHLDLNELAKIATIGGRRASSFLGITLNAMNRDENVEYRLGELAITDDSYRWPIEMCPQDMTPEIMLELKSTFTAWIVGSALRELIEHFCLMLDRAHVMACWVVGVKNPSQQEALERKSKKFKQAISAGHKLRLFEADFGVLSPLCDSLDSLYKARNALTHGFGQVRPHDANDPLGLRITWKGFDSWAEGESTGKRTSVKHLLNKVTTEQLIIKMQLAERSKLFETGTAVALEPIDLSEICFFVAVSCTNEFLQSLLEFLKTAGVNAPTFTSTNPEEYLKDVN